MGTMQAIKPFQPQRHLWRKPSICFPTSSPASSTSKVQEERRSITRINCTWFITSGPLKFPQQFLCKIRTNSSIIQPPNPQAHTVKSCRQSEAAAFRNGHWPHYLSTVIEKEFNVPQESIRQHNGMGKDPLELVHESCFFLDSDFLTDLLQQFDVIHSDSCGRKNNYLVICGQSPAAFILFVRPRSFRGSHN